MKNRLPSFDDRFPDEPLGASFKLCREKTLKGENFFTEAEVISMLLELKDELDKAVKKAQGINAKPDDDLTEFKRNLPKDSDPSIVLNIPPKIRYFLN